MGKLTTQEVNKRLAPRGIQLVNEWQGSGSQNTFKCGQGHTWEVEGTAVVHGGNGCHQCNGGFPNALSTEQVNKRLEPRGICLAEKWKGAHQRNNFVCSKGHTWTTLGLVVVTDGRGCPHCNGAPGLLLPIEEVKRRLELLGLSLVGQYQGVNHDNRFRCSLGHEWEASGTNILITGTGCPECARLKQKNRFARGFD